MDMDFLKTLIVPEVLILIPVLYLLGLWLRNTPNIPDWLDAWMNLVLAIIGCVAIIGFKTDAFIQGVLVAGAASLMKDLIDRTAEGVKQESVKHDDTI